MSPPVIRVIVLTTPPSLKIKVLPKPVVQVKALPRFPASVSVLPPVLLDRTGANYQFSLDMTAINDMIGVSFQPVDADLTAIAALTTTAYGRSLLTLANATALAAEVDSFFLTPAEGNAAYQPLDSDLTAIAALTTTSYGREFLALADAAAARTAIGTVIGTDVQAYDADLAALAANSTNGLWARTGAGTGAARTITGTANEVTVANGDGVSGNPTLSLPTSMTFTGKAILGGTFTSPVFVTPTLGAATGTSLNLSGAGPTTLVLSGATPNIEMGAKASANTPYIDFNSSGNSNDYDVRLIASGGTTAGTGTLTFNGGTFAFSGTVTASTQAALDNSTKVATTAYVDAAVTAGGGGRERLVANRTYYVRTDGSNSNNGLANTSGGAFLTIQKAIDTVAGLDISTYNVTIQVADGTYTTAMLINGAWVGSGTVTILGNTTTPANVILNTTSSDLLQCINGGRITISGAELKTTTSGNCLHAISAGAITLGSALRFGACATYHMWAELNGVISSNVSYSIVGAAGVHYASITNGVIKVSGGTVTVTGTPAFSAAFAYVTRASLLEVIGTTFSGSATGTRYIVSENSVVFVNAAGATYFPGNAAGSTSGGGQYI